MDDTPVTVAAVYTQSTLNGARRLSGTASYETYVARWRNLGVYGTGGQLYLLAGHKGLKRVQRYITQEPNKHHFPVCLYVFSA